MQRITASWQYRKLVYFGILISLTLFLSLGCLTARTPSPAEEQIETAKTMVTNLTADADKAIADGDYYVAAVNLLTLYGNPGIEEKLNAIAKDVPGGLLYTSTPPFYMSFTSRDTLPLPNWPQTANHLLGITLDGSRGIVDEAYNNVATFLIDFPTGALTRWESDTPYPSPDLQWIVDPYGPGDLAVVNIQTGAQIPLCSKQNNQYRWSRDSSKLVATDGNDHLVYIIDIPSGQCTQFNLPGLEWGTEVLLSPDQQQLIIILPGSFSAMIKSELLVSNVDGTGIKKISDLPFYDHDSLTLVSPDGKAIYSDGYVISTVTGNYAKTIYEAVAWLDGAPPSVSNRSVQFLVEPTQGPRGTRFSFNLTGGSAGQEITWFVYRSENMEEYLTYNSVNLNESGSLTDAQGQFGFDTGLATEAGDYIVLVSIGGQKIGEAAFAVTEP